MRFGKLLIAVLIGAGFSGFVAAETLAVGDRIEVRQPAGPAPTRGMTMDQVAKRFGEPQEKLPPVGKPPITRWKYPQFTVYFESKYVIDSVVAG
jgi:hypothetical protein